MLVAGIAAAAAVVSSSPPGFLSMFTFVARYCCLEKFHDYFEYAVCLNEALSPGLVDLCLQMRPEVVGIPCGCVPNGQELTLRLRPGRRACRVFQGSGSISRRSTK